MKEVTEYTKNPVEDIVLQVNEENVTDLRAEITGPGKLYFGAFLAAILFIEFFLKNDLSVRADCRVLSPLSSTNTL
jgi:hypothetical protein